MIDPILKHSYVQINNSLVHVAQYAGHENLLAKNGSNGHSPRPTGGQTSRAGNNTGANISGASGSSNSGGNNNNSNNNNNNIINNNGNNNNNNTSGLNHTHSTNRSSSRFSLDSSAPTVSTSTSQLTLSATTNTADEFGRRLIIFVPGNPGVLGIYHDFLVRLYRIMAAANESALVSEGPLPAIIAIGHNNFDHPDNVDYRVESRFCIDETDMSLVERTLAKNYIQEPHHMELQILNKLIIIKRLLRLNLDECRLVFVGHSIGCYVILRLLQNKLLAASHSGSILIHPTLENIVRTPRGELCNRLFSYKLDLLFQSFAFVLNTLLPKSAKMTIAKWFCSREFVQASSAIALESVTQMICRKTLAALIRMAKSEFASVRNINSETMIKPHAKKLRLVYAEHDDWVNSDNRRFLKENNPELQIEEQPTMHAFVMNPQTVMDYALKCGLYTQDFFDNTNQPRSSFRTFEPSPPRPVRPQSRLFVNESD